MAKKWIPCPEKLQTTFFNPNEQPPEHWAWIVEVFYSREMMDGLGRDPQEPPRWECFPLRPNHFRREDVAHERRLGLIEEYKHYITLGIIDFRVSPKYIGYIPPEDEVWIV